MQLLDNWPWWALYAFFFAGAMSRGLATYTVGRGLRYGSGKTAVARRIDGPRLLRAENLVARYGAFLVTLSFLTVGVQTLINLAAGSLRMPLRRYLVGLIPGALIWALLYTTAGWAIVQAWLGNLSWPALVSAAGLACLVALATFALRRRTQSRQPPPPAAPESRTLYTVSSRANAPHGSDILQ